MTLINPVDTPKQKRRISRKRIILYFFLIFFILLGSSYLIFYVPFGNYDLSPDEDLKGIKTYNYRVPLDPNSPWPKFRANELGNGRSTVSPITNSSATPWSFLTKKGIFSSPVIDQDGTVYIGSADQVFYAIFRNGTLKWSLHTDEIIDSSALLDDQGRVIFGSGDQHMYAVNRENGEILWKFKAHSVSEVEELYGLELQNVNWFEGNLAMLPDGSILAPNDNQILYRLDRKTGEMLEVYLGNEMIWSLPAINPVTNRLFFGSTNFALTNLFSYNYETGDKEWTAGGLGSVAASPLLTSTKENGAVIVGGYDGILRAFTQRGGKQLWKVGMNDHIYSSPAQLSDGTIIQPSADGTVYAINTDGDIIWEFDTFEPIRSSPAIDSNDVIYVGSGEGKLFAINSDGTLRWAYQCILSERNDLNGSPGLGEEGIYIAGESGELFYVPYDYPLSPTGMADPRSTQGHGETMADDGVFLLYTTPFGALEFDPPEYIDYNQPLTFSLFVRQDGDNVLAEIDKDSLSIVVEGSPEFELFIAGNKRFFSIVPKETWSDQSVSSMKISITGEYKTDMKRFGLKFFWGKSAGDLDISYTFKFKSLSSFPNPFQAPNTHNGNSTVFELIRPVAPLPTMLPSYNQIGFDSLHYVAGVVQSNDDNMLLWVIPGKYSENGTQINPQLRERYPLNLYFFNGLLSFYNYDGFAINFIGSWDMPFAFYRISTKYNFSIDTFETHSPLIANVLADEIDYYGDGLKLSGLSDWDTGEMLVHGGIDVGYFGNGSSPIYKYERYELNKGDNEISFQFDDIGLKKDEHVYSILLVDENGNALPLYYSANTDVSFDSKDLLSSISLKFEDDEIVSGDITVYFMIDMYPAISTQVIF